MGGGTEIVNGGSHRKPGGVACCMEQTAGAVANVVRPAEGEVDGQTVVVQPASVCGIADVDVFGCVRDDVPHALLYAHGACGIVHFEGVVGIFPLQCVLGFAQGTSGFGQQIGVMQVGVEHATDKIVGTRIHQTNVHTGNCRAHVDQTALFQRTFQRREAFGAGLREEAQREEEKEKEKSHVHGDKVTFFRAMEKAVVTNWLSLRTCSVFSPFLSFPQRLPPDGW